MKNELGLMIYGYSEEEINILKKHLKNNFENHVTFISSSDMENEIVENIISDINNNIFKQNKTKIIMFLGFDDKNISEFIKIYPTKIKRPIFCGLTQKNIKWKLSYLIEHLIKEHNYWNKKK